MIRSRAAPRPAGPQPRAGLRRAHPGPERAGRHRSMAYEAIRYELADGVATITLNRPDVHNAMNERMREELTRCFGDLAQADAARVVVVTGAGERAFSAGATSAARWTVAASRSSPRSVGGHSAAASSSRWPATSGSRRRTPSSA